MICRDKSRPWLDACFGNRFGDKRKGLVMDPMLTCIVCGSLVFCFACALGLGIMGIRSLFYVVDSMHYDQFFWVDELAHVRGSPVE
jgi:hypothetical protein